MGFVLEDESTAYDASSGSRLSKPKGIREPVTSLHPRRVHGFEYEFVFRSRRYVPNIIVVQILGRRPDLYGEMPSVISACIIDQKFAADEKLIIAEGICSIFHKYRGFSRDRIFFVDNIEEAAEIQVLADAFEPGSV